MKKQKLLLINYWLLIVIGLVSCYPLKRDLFIEKKINSNFCLAKVYGGNDNKIGLWFIKYIYPPDSILNFDGDTSWLRIFNNATHLAYNKDFILLSDFSTKKKKYLIVETQNEKLVKFYPFTKEKNFINKLNKLNCPDTLILKKINN